MPVYKDEKRHSWYALVCYKDWAGEQKRKMKRGFKKQSEAKEWERDFLNQSKNSCDMTVSALYELYLADISSRVVDTTLETKKNIFENHIIPYLGKLSVNNIQPVTIREWQSTLMKETKVSRDNEVVPKYSKTFLHTMNSQLNALLNYAVRYYGLSSNPCHAAGSMGKKQANKMKFWTDEQFNAAISLCHNPSKKLALSIMFWCGLRVGECLALRPKDIVDGRIIVNKTFKKKAGEVVQSGPKSENSYRVVPTPDFLQAEIEDYISRLYGLKPEDRIFYFGKGTLNKELNQLAAAAGLPQIRIHDLRHSHAAILIDMGYSISAVAERLGDTEKVVMETYAHLYPNVQDKIVSDLDKRKSRDTQKNNLEEQAVSDATKNNLEKLF